MQIEWYWFRRLAEVQRLEDTELIKRAFEALAARSFGHRRLSMILICAAAATLFSLMPALIVLALYPAFSSVSFLRIVPPVWRVLFAVAICAATFGGLVYWLWHRPMRRAARQELRRLGVPLCIACGYDCRGLANTRCPECGGELA